MLIQEVFETMKDSCTTKNEKIEIDFEYNRFQYYVKNKTVSLSMCA